MYRINKFWLVVVFKSIYFMILCSFKSVFIGCNGNCMFENVIVSVIIV